MSVERQLQVDPRIVLAMRLVGRLSFVRGLVIENADRVLRFVIVDSIDASNETDLSILERLENGLKLIVPLFFAAVCQRLSALILRINDAPAGASQFGLMPRECGQPQARL